jgi:hypothetical protein
VEQTIMVAVRQHAEAGVMDQFPQFRVFFGGAHVGFSWQVG